MKTEAGREVDSSGMTTATSRIPFFIFLRISGVCGGAGEGRRADGGG